MSFRVERIETRLVDHRLRQDRAIVSAGGVHNASRFLIVIATGGDGIKGYGEAATTALWSGETAETAREIVQHLFAPKLIGRGFDHPRDALAVMDSLAWGNPFAKNAVDTALWDLWTRQQGIRAAKLFADRDPLESIPTRGAVGAYPPEKSLRIASDFWQLGCRTLKFKVGVAGIDDVGRLRAVRNRLGDELVFTIDANGGFRTVDDAVRAIEALLPFRIALCEQPTPRDRIRLLAEVRKKVPVPVMADESIFTPDQLAEALDCDAFDVLSVYPGKNGGFTRSLEMVMTAHKAGKVCSIGSNRETDLGNAASLNLAAGLSAFPVERIACDVVASYYYERSCITHPLVVKDGRVGVPDGNGFGVEPL